MWPRTLLRYALKKWLAPGCSCECGGLPLNKSRNGLDSHIAAHEEVTAIVGAYLGQRFDRHQETVGNLTDGTGSFRCQHELRRELSLN